MLLLIYRNAESRPVVWPHLAVLPFA